MINPPSSIKPYELDMSKVDDSSFSLIKSVTDFTSTPMSAFNFLNKRDYGHFYHLADSAFAPTETSLLSYFVLSNSTISLTNLPSSAYNFLPSSINSNAYTLTGDKLCWGSIN